MATLQKNGTITIDHVALGEKLYKEGKSELNSFFKKDSTMRKGIELLLDAIHHFETAEVHERLAPIWDLIIKTYKSYFVERKDACGTYHHLAKYCEDAGESLWEWETTLARQYFDLATYYHKSDNDFSSAARVYSKLAKMEEDNGRYNNVITAYNNAADAYRAAGSIANAANCNASKAEYLAMKSDYKKAADEFAEIIKTNAVPFENVSYAARSLICIMARCAIQGDFSLAEEWDQHLQNICKTWANSNPRGPLMKILTAFQGGVTSPQGARPKPLITVVTSALLEFDRVHSLTPWSTKMLLKLKNYANGTPIADDSDFSESDDEVVDNKTLTGKAKADLDLVEELLR